MTLHHGPRRWGPSMKLGVLTIFWGFAVLFNRWALDGASPYPILVLRFGLGSLLLLPWLEWKALRRGLGALGPRSFALGTSLFAGFALQLWGLSLTTVSRNGFLSYTYAVFVPLIQSVMGHRRPKATSLGGLALVIVGMLLLTDTATAWQELSTGLNLGDILSLGAALCFALHIVLVSHGGATATPVALTVGQSTVVTLWAGLFALLWPGVAMENNLPTLGSIAWLAIFPTALAFLGQIKWQHQSTPLRAVLIYSLDPLIGFGLGILVFGDPAGWSQVGGGALILAGILWSEWGALRTADPQPAPESGEEPLH